MGTATYFGGRRRENRGFRDCEFGIWDLEKTETRDEKGRGVTGPRGGASEPAGEGLRALPAFAASAIALWRALLQRPKAAKGGRR